MEKTMNTYISISFMSYANEPHLNSGRIYTSNEAAKLNLHLDVPYTQAKNGQADGAHWQDARCHRQRGQ